MRVRLGLALMLVAAACAAREAVRGPEATPPALAPPGVEPHADRADPKSDGPIPWLDGADRLGVVFSRLRSLELGEAKASTEIAVVGDSHTAAGVDVAVVRHAFAERFGDGGRGLLPIGRPWRTYYQEGVAKFEQKGFLSSLDRRSRSSWASDAFLSWLGVAVESHRASAELATTTKFDFDAVDIAFMGQPNGGRFEVLVDDQKARAIDTNLEAPKVVIERIDVPPGPHRVAIRTTSAAPVRIFGANFSRRQPGVRVHAIGINGARAKRWLSVDPASLDPFVSGSWPALVAVAFGSNEATDDDDVEQGLLAVSELVHKLRPDPATASCLVVGPPDMAVRSDGGFETPERLMQIIAGQRRVAHERGCAFFDRMGAMGGAGSIVRWAQEDPPRARGDHVHLTRQGYEDVGRAMADSLLRAYDAWRAKSSAGSRRPVLPAQPTAAERLPLPTAPRDSGR